MSARNRFTVTAMTAADVDAAHAAVAGLVDTLDRHYPGGGRHLLRTLTAACDPTGQEREESVAELATRLNDLGLDMAGEPTFESPERRGGGAAVLRVSVSVQARDQAWTPTLPL